MRYNRKRPIDSDDNDRINKKLKGDSDSEWDPDDYSDNSSDSEIEDSNSINSDDITDIDVNCDDENTTNYNLDLLNEDSLKRRLSKSILEKIKVDLCKKRKKVNIECFLSDLEKKISSCEFKKDKEHKNNIVSLSAIELSNSIIRNLISEIRYEYKYNKNLNLKDYIDNKLELLIELEDLEEDNKKVQKLPQSVGNSSNIIFQLMIDPMRYLDQELYDDDEDDDYIYDENLKSSVDPKDNLDREFHKFLTNGVITPKDDMKYFKNLSKDEKKKYLKTIEELKKTHKVDKPQILKIIESETSFNNKSIIINKLQNFESLPQFSGEYFKLKNWVDGINKIPFGVYNDPPVSLSNSSKKQIKIYLKSVKRKMDDAEIGRAHV